MAMKEQSFPEPSAHPSFMQAAEAGDRKTVLFVGQAVLKIAFTHNLRMLFKPFHGHHLSFGVM